MNITKSALHIMHSMIYITLLFIPFNHIQAKTLEPVSGRSVDIDNIIPADVLARALLLSAEIELIQLELGEPKVKNIYEIVLDASPREVYFQALTSFKKTSRLLFEQTGAHGILPPAIDVRSIKPFHVWKIVNQSYEQILTVKKKLHIDEQIIEKEHPINTSPSDVFSQVILTNNQLNLLLKKRFHPSDSFQKINESVHLMAALLATTPSIRRIPPANVLVRRKTPRDVYDYLIKTRSILTEALKSYGIKYTQLNTNGITIRGSSDVYDLASLLAADLNYVHSLKLSASPAAKTYLSGNKTPSEVYQRVGILNQQLLAFQKLHERQPNWLNQ